MLFGEMEKQMIWKPVMVKSAGIKRIIEEECLFNIFSA